MASDPNTELPRPLAAASAELHLRAADILERMADAFVALDGQWRIVYANREACRINQKPLEAFQGKVHWDEWPAAVGTEIGATAPPRHGREGRGALRAPLRRGTLRRVAGD